MQFALIDMAQWLKHHTLDNLIELEFLGCGYEQTKWEFVLSFSLIYFQHINLK